MTCSEREMLQAAGDECQVLEVHEEVFGEGLRHPISSFRSRFTRSRCSWRANFAWRAGLAKSRAMLQSDEQTPAAPPARVYSYNAGVEVEAAGRPPAKNWLTLRRDLAALPWLLAGPHDVVLAPPQRPAAASRGGPSSQAPTCCRLSTARARAAARTTSSSGKRSRDTRFAGASGSWANTRCFRNGRLVSHNAWLK